MLRQKFLYNGYKTRGMSIPIEKGCNGGGVNFLIKIGHIIHGDSCKAFSLII